MLRLRCTAPITLAAITVMFGCIAPRVGAESGVVISVENTVDAIWRVQRVDFTYRSAEVYYSCRALQSKIGAILKAVGAHQQMAVDVGCMSGELVRNAFARVTLAMPAVATQENVVAATTFDSRAQLVARVRKVRLPTANDIERFPAAWQTVSLSRDRGLRLEPGDCDLLRGMHEQIFPRLSIRVTQQVRCATGSTRMRPNLEVTALMPVRMTSVTYAVK